MGRYTVIGVWFEDYLLIAGVAEGEVPMVDTKPERFAEFVTAGSPEDAERQVLAEHS